MWQGTHTPYSIHHFSTRNVHDEFMTAENILGCPVREVAAKGYQGRLKDHHGDSAFWSEVGQSIIIQRFYENNLSKEWAWTNCSRKIFE
jgi:hypothetical protein